MVRFKTSILRFGQMGEKTGWTYIEIPAIQASQLYPGNKKSFRVKGKLDQVPVKQLALLPMGDGHFIIPLNAEMRKALKKQKGAELYVQLEKDESPITINNDLISCLEDEPAALRFFQSLQTSHQHYFSKWIETAKSDSTKSKRIAQTVNACLHHYSFSEMLRNSKKDKA